MSAYWTRGLPFVYGSLQYTVERRSGSASGDVGAFFGGDDVIGFGFGAGGLAGGGVGGRGVSGCAGSDESKGKGGFASSNSC